MADIIRQLVPTLPNRRVLCLGYPDILQAGEPPEDAERQSIAKWHNWKGGIEHAGHFFGSQNLSPEYWDVTQARGPEKIVDLNTLGGKWHEHDSGFRAAPQFALIIDPGTLEHIPNIGNCWRAICAVTAVGGLVIHCNPMGLANHGMYSIHPTAYADVYEDNGFKIEMLLELSGPLDKRVIREAPKHQRYQATPESTMLCVARKVEDVPFSWPIQAKYRKNPTLKAAQ